MNSTIPNAVHHPVLIKREAELIIGGIAKPEIVLVLSQNVSRFACRRRRGKSLTMDNIRRVIKFAILRTKYHAFVLRDLDRLTNGVTSIGSNREATARSGEVSVPNRERCRRPRSAAQHQRGKSQN